MLQAVSGRGTWNRKRFKMSLAEALGAGNASRCLWQRDLEQEMLQDVSGRGTWSRKCFNTPLAEALGARNASRCLSQTHLEQEMLQDVSGRGTWSRKCFKMSLVGALGAGNVSRCLWQRHLEQEMLQDVSGEQEMLQDVSGRGTWSRKCFKMSLTEALQPRNRNASRCLWQRHLEREMLQDVHLEREMLQDVYGTGTWSEKCLTVPLAEALGPGNASRCLWQRHLERENASRCL